MADILIRGYKAKEQIEDIIKEARYAANNCMIGSGLEIIELPEHGDLIDLDVLKHKFCAHCDGYENDTGACADGDQDCMDAKIIMNAPVIVPASKEETE